MKALQDIIRLIFISVIGGILLLYFQNQYEDYRSKSGISALGISGPIWPVPEEGKDGKLSLEKQKSYLDESNFVARIVLNNKSNKPIEKGRIAFDQDLPGITAVIYNTTTRHTTENKDFRVVDLEKISPGDSIYVFLNSSRGFGWPFFLDDFHIYTEHGEIPIEFHSQKTDLGYGDGDRKENFLEFIVSRWKYIIVVGAILLILLNFISEHLFKAYYRKILLDDDFWLSEKERMEDIGFKKFIPDMKNMELPKSSKE